MTAQLPVRVRQAKHVTGTAHIVPALVTAAGAGSSPLMRSRGSGSKSPNQAGKPDATRA
jgi:hypothetical protein